MSFQQSTNPATGVLIDKKIECTNPEDMPQIMENARNAQNIWRKKSFKERAKHIKKIKQFLLENIDEAIEVIYTSNGKTRFDAIGTEVLPCIMSIDYYTSSEARKILESRSIGPGHIMFANKRNFIEYLPVGVVGIISPWNYPFSIPFGEVIMGLVAGNAIILKVAKECVIIGEFIERCIAAAGLPEGLFHHLVARGSAAAKLMFDNGIDKLFFTGSVNVGKILMKQAADTLTPLSLELGGKDPMIVLEDANIERATNCACWAGYQNAGQSCGGIERVYVAASIYDEFVDLLAKKTKALRHGVDNDENDFNVDIGSITTQSQYNLIEEHVNEAVEEGAEIIAQSQSVGNIDGGLFYPATLLVNVSHDMRVIREETFGPVVPVMKFDTIEEAIELANDSDFALTCSVWTENTKLGKKIAREVQSGAACVNDHLYTHGMANTPWGGPKLSGLGRTHGELGLKEMCEAKLINTEILPSSFVPRNLWWYPFNKKGFEVMKNAAKFIGSDSYAKKLTAALAITPYSYNKMVSKWDLQNRSNNGHGFRNLLFFSTFLILLSSGITYFLIKYFN